jgi:hypothetical protein
VLGGGLHVSVGTAPLAADSRLIAFSSFGHSSFWFDSGIRVSGFAIRPPHLPNPKP